MHSAIISSFLSFVHMAYSKENKIEEKKREEKNL
jgi:hypothetical protein